MRFGRFIFVAFYLLFARALALPLLRARIAQHLPRPFEPGMATPTPSPTPSAPDGDDGEFDAPAEQVDGSPRIQ
jgi:hypothetical protein